MAAKLEKTRTPGIYKRGSRYVVVYRVKGKQVWESCRTYDGARRAKSARTADIARGEFQERSRVTLHEYSREWIVRYHGRGRRGFREHTRTDYERQLEQYALRFFSERVRLTEITPSDIARFVSWLCDGRAQARNDHALALAKARNTGNEEPSPLPQDAKRVLADGTVRNVLAPLRACLATAVREGILRSNPAREVDLPHRPVVRDGDEGPLKVLSTEQLATFLRIVHPRHRLFFQLLAATGLRISEAIALRWRDVQLDGSSPHVKVRRAIVRGDVGLPKSKYGRRDVPIAFDLVRELRERHSATEWHRPDDLVFTSRTGSALMPNNLLRRALKPAAEEAGAPWAGFHTFRHTCASLLFAQGRNAVQVQRWLGHHSAAFTLATYVHLLDGDIGAPLDIAPASEDYTLRSTSNITIAV